MHTRIIAATLGLLCAAQGVRDNNIQITNPVLTNQNSGTKTVELQFDVSWENS